MVEMDAPSICKDSCVCSRTTLRYDLYNDGFVNALHFPAAALQMVLLHICAHFQSTPLHAGCVVLWLRLLRGAVLWVQSWLAWRHQSSVAAAAAADPAPRGAGAPVHVWPRLGLPQILHL